MVGRVSKRRWLSRGTCTQVNIRRCPRRTARTCFGERSPKHAHMPRSCFLPLLPAPSSHAKRGVAHHAGPALPSAIPHAPLLPPLHPCHAATSHDATCRLPPRPCSRPCWTSPSSRCASPRRTSPAWWRSSRQCPRTRSHPCRRPYTKSGTGELRVGAGGKCGDQCGNTVTVRREGHMGPAA